MNTNASHLTDEHRNRLRSNYGIDPDDPKVRSLIEKGQLKSVDDPDELQMLLLRSDISGTGIYIGYPNQKDTFTIRLDEPLVHDGKRIKYLKRAGQPNRLFTLPDINIDKSSEIIITEGELKAIAGGQFGLPVVALSGIWCWRTKDPQSKDEELTDDKAILSELKRDWKGKKIVLMYDSDITRTHQAYPAFERLAEQLYRLKAKEVKIVTLPSLNAESKTGLDDFLLARKENSLRELRLLIDQAKPYQPLGDLTLENITDKDKNGKLKLSSTKASNVVLKTLPLAISENSDKLFAFDGYLWKLKGERVVDMVLCRVAGDLVTKYSVNEVIRRIQNRLAESPIKFDHNPYLFPLENGIVDLRTREFREIAKNDHITFRYAARYDPAILDIRQFLWFLCSVFPDPLDVLTVLDIITATAIRIPFEVLVLLIGSGSNGKGKLEKLLLQLFTKERATAITLQEVKQSRFGPASLLDKDLWIVSEVERVKDAINILKKIATGELIDSDVKYSGRVQGSPHAITIMDTNKAFDFGDDTHGRKRRLIKLDWPYEFGDLDNQRPIDRHLEEKLKKPEVLSGLVQIIVARAPSLIESMKIYQRKQSKEVEAEYDRQQFSLNYFCEDCLSKMPLKEGDDYINYKTGQLLKSPHRATVDEFYNEYLEYCKLFNVTDPAEIHQFGSYIRVCYEISSDTTSRIQEKEKVSFRYYPGLYIVKSAKAAYGEHRMEYAAEDSLPPIGGENYSYYRDTTEILQRWIGDSSISNLITTDTTDNFLFDMVDEIQRMFVYISSHDTSGEIRKITYEDYLQFSCSICGNQDAEVQLSPMDEEIDCITPVVSPMDADNSTPDDMNDANTSRFDERIAIAAKIELITCNWIDPAKIASKLGLPLEIIMKSLNQGFNSYAREGGCIGYKGRPSVFDYVAKIPATGEVME